MKKVIVITGLFILLGYLVFAAFYFEEKPKEQICNHFEIVTDKNNGSNMIDLAEIEKEIDGKNLNPYGKSLKEVNTYAIQEVILTNKMVRAAEVFVTNTGGIRAVLKERKPILRVISTNGENYYIDKEGERVPLSKSFVADLPLVTGDVKESFAKNELHDFALYLAENEFWFNQIEQIVVLANNEIKLIPKVGEHRIILGKIDNYKEKLNKLRVFYDKGLSETGWNRYSEINLKYDKQVVATKR